MTRARSLIVTGDCRDVLRTMPDASIDAVVTDPPYGLSQQPDALGVLQHWLAGDDYQHKGGGYMGKSWDSFVPGPATWREVLRVLKPGGHACVFAGSRTVDLMGLALRIAGFEIRDQLQWLYGKGVPKSRNVSKDIDKMHGATIDDAKRWYGWGTALKPMHEPIILVRKPLRSTIANTVLTHGTGAMNIDGCRIGVRWPANVILDPDAGEILDQQSGVRAPGVSRFFYNAKTSTSEREAGLEHMRKATASELTGGRAKGSAGLRSPRSGTGYSSVSGRANVHPTVKPISLMRWLVRLVCPPGGVVLDPFTGSGSTGCAAVLEPTVCAFVGVELSPEYAEIARARIEHWRAQDGGGS